MMISSHRSFPIGLVEMEMSDGCWAIVKWQERLTLWIYTSLLHLLYVGLLTSVSEVIDALTDDFRRMASFTSRTRDSPAAA